MIRILLLSAVLLGAAGPTALPLAAADADAAHTVEIIRLWTGYRDAQSFVKFGELPKVDNEPGDAIVLRSQPESRDGFYFTVRVRAVSGNDGRLPDGQVVLHVVAPEAVQPRVFSFPYAAGGQRSVQFLVGMTGSDWTYGTTMPLAWKIDIVDGTGQVVGGRQSFLWGKP